MSDRAGSSGGDDRFAPDLPDTVEVRPGETVRYPLVSAAGAGYRWDVQALESAGSADVSVGRDEERAVAPSTADGLPTSEPVPIALTVRGVQAGRSTWRLRLVRPWAPDAPLVEVTLDVVVLPPP